MAEDVKTEAAGRKFNLMEFVRETRREIAKVTWPTRKETLSMTAAIIAMAIVTGLFFLAVDSVLGYVVSHVLGMNS